MNRGGIFILFYVKPSPFRPHARGGLGPGCLKLRCRRLLFGNFFFTARPSLISVFCLLASFLVFVYQLICFSVVVGAHFSPRTNPHTHTGTKLGRNHNGPALGKAAKMNWPLWRPSGHMYTQTQKRWRTTKEWDIFVLFVLIVYMLF